jgi:hypothetical protein
MFCARALRSCLAWTAVVRTGEDPHVVPSRDGPGEVEDELGRVVDDVDEVRVDAVRDGVVHRELQGRRNGPFALGRDFSH